MKACIVTVYNSTNCGSFLQAYALKYIIEKQGVQVKFLKTGIKKNGCIFVKKTLRNLKRLRFKHIVFDYRVYRNFKKCKIHLPECSIKGDELKKQELFILGSDEIWNVSREIIRNALVFWGEGLPGKVITYAPSLNTASEQDVGLVPNVSKMLERINFISVRDNYSKSIIEKYTNKEVSVLCDPTFLLPMSEYINLQGTCPYKNFILIYSGGGRFKTEDIKKIKQFAQNKNLKLVAFPHNLSWCDYQIPANPMDAIAIFREANYVITDTFHGTAFSLIFNKEFVAVPRGNTKVIELLKFFGVDNLMNDSFDDLELYFSKENYDKEKLNSKILQEREKAICFLKESIDLVGEEYNAW